MILSVMAALALAQDAPIPPMNAQLFRPSIDGGSTLWVDDATFSRGTLVSGRLVFGYARDPLLFRYDDDGETVKVLSDVVQADLVAGVALGRVRLGVDVPLILDSHGQAIRGARGIGDMSFDLKVGVLERTPRTAGFALGSRIGVPTSQVDAPLGDPVATNEFQAIVDHRVGRTLVTGNFGGRVAAVDGQVYTEWRVRPFLRGAAAFELTERAGVSFELAAYGKQAWSVTLPTGSAAEGLVGGWYRLNKALVLRGGVGRGVVTGAGASDLRAIAALGFELPRALDSDFDGIPDRLDECPFEPEDVDGFEDEDGCPDLDNDGDGVPDRYDACVNWAEDLDGYEDEDGCPEPETEVHFRVSDASGKVAPGGRITVSGVGISTRSGGADLRVVLLPGAYTFRAEAPGHEPLEQTVVVEEGRKVEVLRTLSPAASLGRVELVIEDFAGTPVADASWRVVGGRFERLRGEALSLATGDWELELYARERGVSRVRVQIAEGENEALRVILPASRVRVDEGAVVFEEPLVFDAEGALSPESAAVGVDLARLLLERPKLHLVRLEGRGSGLRDADLNAAMGRARAVSLRSLLVAEGVDIGRVSVMGVEAGQEVPPVAVIIEEQLE